MSKGSNYRVRWCRTFAKNYNKIFHTEVDISDIKMTNADIKEDLDFKGGHNNKSSK